ncbi:hypothetical protein F4680DRAFT_463389, partial [Xylaria scruposa]
VAPSVDTNQSPRPSRLRISEANEKDKTPAPSPRQGSGSAVINPKTGQRSMPTGLTATGNKSATAAAKAKRSRRPTSETTLLIGAVQAAARAKTYTAPAASMKTSTGRANCQGHRCLGREVQAGAGAVAKLEAKERRQDRRSEPSPSSTKMLCSRNQPSNSHAHDKNPASKGEGSRGAVVDDPSGVNHGIGTIVAGCQSVVARRSRDRRDRALSLNFHLGEVAATSMCRRQTEPLFKPKEPLRPAVFELSSYIKGHIFGNGESEATSLGLYYEEDKITADSVDATVDIVIDPTTLRRIGREEIPDLKGNVVMTLFSKDPNDAPMKVVFDRAMGSKAGIRKAQA